MALSDVLVPIRVQALVIDDDVVTRPPTRIRTDQGSVVGDGRWSPRRRNYRPTIAGLRRPDAPPFLNANRTGTDASVDPLALSAGSSSLAGPEDRGVYVRWDLPAGLRHSHRPDSVAFPALPDQWLIVRYARTGTSDPALRAWFLDSGVITETAESAPDSSTPCNVLVPGASGLVAACAGRSVRLEDHAPEDFAGPRTTITAAGNRYTGSPSFTASVAENRDVLSWHDDLAGVPPRATLGYAVVGWYRDPRDEPFRALPALLDGRPVLTALRWTLPGVAGTGEDPGRRCVFHGAVTAIDYADRSRYQGPLLGYPGSPAVPGAPSTPAPPFAVGVGPNIEDALLGLVADESAKPDDRAELWRALEAVLYHRPDTLIGGWNAAPRDQDVHRAWFTDHDGGRTWRLGHGEQDAAISPATPPATPTPDQRAALAELNAAQADADAVGRELSALQQELHGWWWRLCLYSLDPDASVGDETAACLALVEQATTLRSRHADALRLRDEAAAMLRLPAGLELRQDPAPAFHRPADPVLVLAGAGSTAPAPFPDSLPCRSPAAVAISAETAVDDAVESYRSDAAGGIADVTALVQASFPDRADTLAALLAEATLAERAVADLRRRLLPAGRTTSRPQWEQGLQRLTAVLAQGATGMRATRVRLRTADGDDIPPARVVTLWGRQPWAPLHLDWEITWRPDERTGDGVGASWELGEADYHPVDGVRPDPDAETRPVRGRSLLTPLDRAVLDEPVSALRRLVADRLRADGDPATAAVAAILNQYDAIWSAGLDRLARGGMQALPLTGLIDTLLGRYVTLPRIAPDPQQPWVVDTYIDVRLRDAAMDPVLAPVTPAAPRLPPPVTPASDAALPFTSLAAGAFTVDQLWLVDGFGQWVDLLAGSSAGGSSGQRVAPRSRWDNDARLVTLPPRVVQPARLTAGIVPSGPAGVRAWIFHHPLDRSLVVCDAQGRACGEIAEVRTGDRRVAQWSPAPGAPALDGSTAAFVDAVVAPGEGTRTRLRDLLALIGRASERIRPAAARSESVTRGRPLALVDATIGLELFGRAWTGLTDPAPAVGGATGDPVLDALRVPVVLGDRHDTEDGLIGWFPGGDAGRIVPTRAITDPAWTSGFVADPAAGALQAGFGVRTPVTLLMDPWGTVRATCGIVPSVTLALPRDAVQDALPTLPTTLRVGPVLLAPDGPPTLPVPLGEPGRWWFRGPAASDQAAAVAPPDPRRQPGRPVVVTEGHLSLVRDE